MSEHTRKNITEKLERDVKTLISQASPNELEETLKHGAGILSELEAMGEEGKKFRAAVLPLVEWFEATDSVSHVFERYDNAANLGSTRTWLRAVRQEANGWLAFVGEWREKLGSKYPSNLTYLDIEEANLKEIITTIGKLLNGRDN